MSVARGPLVCNVGVITELSHLRVSVETFVAPKNPVQWERYQRLSLTQRKCGLAPR